MALHDGSLLQCRSSQGEPFKSPRLISRWKHQIIRYASLLDSSSISNFSSGNSKKKPNKIDLSKILCNVNKGEYGKERDQRSSRSSELLMHQEWLGGQETFSDIDWEELLAADASVCSEQSEDDSWLDKLGVVSPNDVSSLENFCERNNVPNKPDDFVAPKKIIPNSAKPLTEMTQGRNIVQRPHGRSANSSKVNPACARLSETPMEKQCDSRNRAEDSESIEYLNFPAHEGKPSLVSGRCDGQWIRTNSSCTASPLMTASAQRDSHNWIGLRICVATSEPSPGSVEVSHGRLPHLLFKNDDIYARTFQQGRQGSQGVYVWVNGSVYAGNFSYKNQQGNGRHRIDATHFLGKFNQDNFLEAPEECENDVIRVSKGNCKKRRQGHSYFPFFRHQEKRTERPSFLKTCDVPINSPQNRLSRSTKGDDVRRKSCTAFAMPARLRSSTINGDGDSPVGKKSACNHGHQTPNYNSTPTPEEAACISRSDPIQLAIEKFQKRIDKLVEERAIQQSLEKKSKRPSQADSTLSCSQLFKTT